MGADDGIAIYKLIRDLSGRILPNPVGEVTSTAGYPGARVE